jgi:hypothetical protein
MRPVYQDRLGTNIGKASTQNNTVFSGGAYMPLELSYPKDLLERAIDETDAVLTLTTSEYADRLSPAHKQLLMEGDWLSELPPNLPAMPEGGFQPKPNIDDLAYVVMSSVSRNGSLFEPFIYKNALFTKTGSGQT